MCTYLRFYLGGPSFRYRRVPVSPMAVSAHMVRMKMNHRILAVLMAASGALALSGCQAPAVLDRTVSLTSLPDEAFTPDDDDSAGLDLRFGSTVFGITCATESSGDSTRGTAALVCSWKGGAR